MVGTIFDGGFHSPLFSGCHGKGLLAVEVVVPCGGTGGGGGCETGSECEVEGGAGGLAGGGGSGTLVRKLATGSSDGAMDAHMID